MKNADDLPLRVVDAIRRAEGSDWCLPDSVTSIKSFTGHKVQHFLDALCSHPDTVYLEIGTWNGGTMAAAAWGNLGSFTGIDRFSDFGGSPDGTREKFREVGVNARLIEADCWTVPMAELPQGVNVFFYDGPHDFESHRRALPHFAEIVAPQFIFVVDDWEDDKVREATALGILDANLKTLAYHRLGQGEHESQAGWWNALGVFALAKDSP